LEGRKKRHDGPAWAPEFKAPADKEKILWRNAAAFFNLEVAG
jgi:hypothetical protein